MPRSNKRLTATYYLDTTVHTIDDGIIENIKKELAVFDLVEPGKYSIEIADDGVVVVNKAMWEEIRGWCRIIEGGEPYTDEQYRELERGTEIIRQVFGHDLHWEYLRDARVQ